MSELITYHEALQLIEKHIKRTHPIDMLWIDSLNQTLAADIHASENVPPFDNSAVDGFAVQSEDLSVASQDLPVALQLREEIFASKIMPSEHVDPGFTTKVMTGAPVPQGADAVVMVEHTKQEDDRILFYKNIEAGQNIRYKAEEIKKGDKILNSGELIHSTELGILAQQGIQRVQVRKNPTVAILATGDELVEPHLKPIGGQIRNSNTYTLSAELQNISCPVINLGIGRDNPQVLKDLIQQAIDQADFIITSGGVSAGEKDYLPPILKNMGMNTIFHKLAVKPGKPLLFGILDSCYVFGLPGNVVSSMVSFHLFIKPAIRLFCGQNYWQNPIQYVRLGKPISNIGNRTNFVRCHLKHTPNDLPIAQPTGNQGSGMLSSMRHADGLAILQSDKNEYHENDIVEFIPI